jgi:hypothetical protein
MTCAVVDLDQCCLKGSALHVLNWDYRLEGEGCESTKESADGEMAAKRFHSAGEYSSVDDGGCRSGKKQIPFGSSKSGNSRFCDSGCAVAQNDKSFSGWSKEQATATAKCGGLSTAQQTMRLSVAPVEMTLIFR